LTPVLWETASLINFGYYFSGRAGIKGTAYTLVTEKDKEFVGHIVRNLEAANQDVTKELMELVSQKSVCVSVCK
jgi:superfamily II DNA/RNA helicase